MSSSAAVKSIVLDANILIRAILGVRVQEVLQAYAADVWFFAPENAFVEATFHLPKILERKGLSGDAFAALNGLAGLVESIPQSLYEDLESDARERLRSRDEDDWHCLALALSMNCPLWTEDRDFFGTGISTWTTDKVEIYLRVKSIDA